MHSFSKTKALSPFKVVDFWQHSIATGIATRLIGVGIGAKELENYFLAGVLHDIGKLVFFQFAEKDFERALDMSATRGISLQDAEQKIFEANHSVAGQMLAQKWKLPVALQEAIYFHHTGSIPGKQDKLVAAVFLGDTITKLLKLGNAGDSTIPRPDPVIWDILKLPDKYFTKIRKQLVDDYNATVRVMLYD
jgi:HD-like signal output (HDOD) protein